MKGDVKMKVKIFTGVDYEEIEKRLNDFVSNKDIKIINILQSESVKPFTQNAYKPSVTITVLYVKLKTNSKKKLREDLLKELYDLCFNNTRDLSLRIDKNLEKVDYEKYLAYKYLLSKNMIKNVGIKGSFDEYQITTYGIDYIESCLLDD